jgi:hypothetical protein
MQNLEHLEWYSHIVVMGYGMGGQQHESHPTPVENLVKV